MELENELNSRMHDFAVEVRPIVEKLEELRLKYDAEILTVTKSNACDYQILYFTTESKKYATIKWADDENINIKEISHDTMGN